MPGGLNQTVNLVVDAADTSGQCQNVITNHIKVVVRNRLQFPELVRHLLQVVDSCQKIIKLAIDGRHVPGHCGNSSIDNDEVFIDVNDRPGIAGPHAGQTFEDVWGVNFDHTRYSALDRDAFESKADLSYRFGREDGGGSGARSFAITLHGRETEVLRELSDLLSARDDALGVPELDDDRAAVHPLDDAIDHVADAALVVAVHDGPLGLADPLEQDLAGGLGSDAAEL